MSKRLKRNNSKLFLTRGLLFLLILALLLPLAACSRTPEIVQTGITLSPDKEQSLASEVRAETTETIYALLAHYASSTSTQSLPEATKAKLRTHAAAITDILACAVSEVRITEMNALLQKNGSAAIDAYCNKAGANSNALRALYLDLTALLGAERLGNIAYALTLYRYQALAATARERYEKYGYTYLLADAIEYERIHTDLQKDIGIENFSIALRLGMMLSDLLVGIDADNRALESFSPAEILVFLQHIPLEKLDIDDKGWHLLLSLTVPTSPTSYQKKLLITAEKNGDLALVSAEINTLVGILATLQARMNTDTAALLQTGDRSAFLHTLFHLLNADEQTALLRITTLDFHLADYEAIALDTYGIAYQTYKEGLPHTAWENLQSAAAEGFADTLLAYLRGISPALFYRA